MQTFKQFVEQAEGWHASKQDIVKMWENLKPSPILMTPIPEHHQGSRLHQDGLRITGTPQFISSVLGRLKDILQYENNPSTRLDLEYRQVTNKDGVVDKGGFLCYVYVEQDTKKAKHALKP